MLSKTGISILLIVLLVSDYSICLAAGTFENGLKHHALGRYQHAVIYFSLAVEESPQNALAHYYLADSLVRTGHHEQAIVEYGLSYRLDPHGQVSAYCKKALAAYKQPSPKFSLSKIDTTGSATPFDDSGPVIPSSNEDELIARTKSHIRQELTFEKVKHQMMGDTFASGALGLAEAEARLIQEEAAHEIELATQPQAATVGKIVQYAAPDPELAKARVEEIKRRAQEKTEASRKSAQARADLYKQWSRLRQESLDEVASNLESQLDQPTGQSGVKLQPIGTDLYTRFYGGLRLSNQLPDVHPAAARIIDHQPVLTGSECLPAGAGDDNKPHTRKVVRGSVLH
jgi:tetratricopeptide (TPR) repeat protein